MFRNHLRRCRRCPPCFADAPHRLRKRVWRTFAWLRQSPPALPRAPACDSSPAKTARSVACPAGRPVTRPSARRLPRASESSRPQDDRSSRLSDRPHAFHNVLRILTRARSHRCPKRSTALFFALMEFFGHVDFVIIAAILLQRFFLEPILDEAEA